MTLRRRSRVTGRSRSSCADFFELIKQRRKWLRRALEGFCNGSRGEASQRFWLRHTTELARGRRVTWWLWSCSALSPTWPATSPSPQPSSLRTRERPCPQPPRARRASPRSRAARTGSTELRRSPPRTSGSTLSCSRRRRSKRRRRSHAPSATAAMRARTRPIRRAQSSRCGARCGAAKRSGLTRIAFSTGEEALWRRTERELLQSRRTERELLWRRSTRRELLWRRSTEREFLRRRRRSRRCRENGRRRRRRRRSSAAHACESSQD
mmetsp:Transcript_19936/g.64902  ORF Transcript_19936/g.64902 Transcript_19936/m.64902 type:complete len:267 (-) Transcript_19936:15-815(-)